jgi:hypothetical protein
MASRTLAVAAALALLSSTPALAGSWLVGEASPASPEAPRARLLGLLEESPDLVPYQHPFAVSSWKLAASQRVMTAEPGGVYLLRTLPQDDGGALGMAFVRNHLQAAREQGFRPFGPLPSPRLARVPLLTMARFDGEESHAVTGDLQVTPVETARVHLCLIGLGEEADGSDSHEAPLYVSAPLSPELALRRAAAVSRYATRTWGVSGHASISHEELREMWPEAMENLTEAGHAPGDVLLALRVLWTSGEASIPGPGGHLLKAADPVQANRKLRALYASRDELSH